jgi:hypothetical protein
MAKRKGVKVKAKTKAKVKPKRKIRDTYLEKVIVVTANTKNK